MLHTNELFKVSPRKWKRKRLAVPQKQKQIYRANSEVT